jgi:hypothetical protein
MTVQLRRPKQPVYMRWTIAVLCAWDARSGLGSQPQTLEPGPKTKIRNSCPTVALVVATGRRLL